MIVEGQRFVPLTDARYDISPHSGTAVVASKQGGLVVPVGDYEIFGNQIYVAEDLALAPVGGGVLAATATATAAGSTGLGGWITAPLMGLPVMGVMGATLWHHLAPGVLRFANEGRGHAFENSTEVRYAAAVVHQEQGPEDSLSLRFALTGEGEDDAHFTIDPDTGTLQFIMAPDYESPRDANADNLYQVEVEVTDGSETAFQAVSVRVQNLDETPIWLSVPQGTAAENDTQTSFVARAIDEDAGAGLSYRLTGLGADDDLFTLDPQTGALRLNEPKDFESPRDADGDNAYQVQVAVFDSLNTAVQDVTIQLIDVNEAPVLSAFPSVSSMDEGQTDTGFSATAFDPDAGDTVQYYLSPGALDNAFFGIDPSTGALSFRVAPEAQAPADADGNNAYEVEIYAQDSGLLTDLQTVTIDVLDAT